MAAADAQSAKQSAAANLQQAQQEVVARQAQESASVKEGVAEVWAAGCSSYGGCMWHFCMGLPCPDSMHTGWLQPYIRDWHVTCLR